MYLIFLPLIIESLLVSVVYNNVLLIETEEVLPLEGLLLLIKDEFFKASYMISMENIYGKWALSDQKDIDNSIMTYRPWSEYNMTSNRTGFEILPSGDFIIYEIGPDDRPLRIQGKYKIEGSNIWVNLENYPLKSFTLEIISLEKSLLKVRLANQ